MQKQKYGYSKQALTQWFCRSLLVVLLLSPIYLFAQPQDANELATKEELKQREQDSLMRLLETGQADTIRYTYQKIGGIKLDDGTGFSRIEVKPRIDSVSNELGTKSSGTVWMLLGITVLLVYFCYLLITKHVYRGKIDYMLIYIVICFLGGLLIYSVLSCIYSNLDEIRVRKYAKEEMATLDYEGSWEQYRYRNRWKTEYVSRNSFVFTGEDSIRIRVSQDNATFDRDDYQSETDTVAVKVRYDSATRKLAVDDDRYLIDNLWQILFMCFLLLLIFLFCCGKFNKQLKKFLCFMTKRPVKKKQIVLEQNDIVDMPCVVYTSWAFTSKRYDSMDQFVRDVKRSEQQQNMKADSGLNPDRVIIEGPDFIIRVFDEDITANNDLCIVITPDDGESITEAELLFKLHNQMIPYVGRLVTCTLEEIDFFGEPKEGKPIECILMFEWAKQ